jgi:hypothetical protein
MKRLSQRVTYEFGVDLVYEGKSITMKRVVACIPPYVPWRTFPATANGQ